MASLSGFFTKKVIVGLSAVVTIFAIVSGIWGFEIHYASNSRVNKVEEVTQDKFDDLEVTIAGALQNQQYKSDVRYYQIMDDKLRDDIYQLRKQLERNPSDELLKKDYEYLLDKRKQVQEKIEDSMKNIKVN